jgi:hypothetical protein
MALTDKFREIAGSLTHENYKRAIDAMTERGIASHKLGLVSDIQRETDRLADALLKACEVIDELTKARDCFMSVLSEDEMCERRTSYTQWFAALEHSERAKEILERM